MEEVKWTMEKENCKICYENHAYYIVQLTSSILPF